MPIAIIYMILTFISPAGATTVPWWGSLDQCAVAAKVIVKKHAWQVTCVDTMTGEIRHAS